MKSLKWYLFYPHLIADLVAINLLLIFFKTFIHFLLVFSLLLNNTELFWLKFLFKLSCFLFFLDMCRILSMPHVVRFHENTPGLWVFLSIHGLLISFSSRKFCRMISLMVSLPFLKVLHCVFFKKLPI
jgi:hypothetical protein